MGYGAIISAAEGSALLALWFAALDTCLAVERRRRGDENPDAWGAARVRATLQACEVFYKRVVTEEDLLSPDSELGRKANLFYIFMEQLQFVTHLAPAPKDAS
jgi:hypothetical protein